MEFQIGDNIKSNICPNLLGKIIKINGENIIVKCRNTDILFHKNYITKTGVKTNGK